MKRVFSFLTAVSLLIVFTLLYGCKKNPDMPTLTTTAVTSVTTNSASSGGNITDDGGAEVTARGVCWGTSANPTVTGSHTSDGTGVGVFTSSITDLTPNTLYYVRAYATNSAGTAYGDELSFETEPIIGATVTTAAVSTYTSTTAVMGGEVTSDGGAAVTERGVCWGATANPATSGSHLAIGSGVGVFSNNITGLTRGTLYHVRAYAVNSAGTTYGNDVSFTTAALKPTVTTTAVTVFTQTTATAGGNVSDDGGATVDERGVCYGTATAPTLETASHVAAAAGGTGVFTCNLASLTPNTLYYVRAYAKNSAGTEYGNEVTFTTSPIGLATVSTTTPVLIPTSTTSVTAGGNVTSDGGGTVTERGVCWSISASPEITDSHVAASAGGTGTFEVTMTSLEEGTVYYVRAYAVNSAGPAYGNQLQVLTMMSDADNNIYKTVQIGTQIWMAENLKTTKYKDGITGIPLEETDADWAALTTPAYCWYQNDEATYGVIYGALYNWHAVNTGNLCPNGWSVPTDEEWTTLTDYLGGVSVAGGKLKETGITHWLDPNTGATNESGFTALPGGYRYQATGNFADVGKLSYWWSRTVYEYDAGKAYYREMFNDQASVYREAAFKPAGKYVRCIKD